MIEASCREGLTCNERQLLKRLRRPPGYRLVGPEYRPCESLKGLVAKGYVRVLPGLLDETPQGYVPAD